MDLFSKIMIIIGLSNLAAIVGTLIFIARQSLDTSKTLMQIIKSNRFLAVTGFREHEKDINTILLNDEELRNLFQFSKQDILALMLFADHEKLFLYHKEGLIDDEYWEAQKAIILRTLDREFMKEVWRTHANKESFLHKDYNEFIEAHYAIRIDTPNKAN